MTSSPTGELFFDDVRLTPDRLLGETEQHEGGDGRDSARADFVAERIGIGAMSLGIIDECHRLCVDYAKLRTPWGKEIGQCQLIRPSWRRWKWLERTGRAWGFRLSSACTRAACPSIGEAAAMKWYSSEVGTEVARAAVQLFGGNGYMTEYRVEQLACDAKSLMIYAGSNEVEITHVAKGPLSA
jgi:alkylation response protein AidB-like acyl-CoA dehydrogenase